MASLLAAAAGQVGFRFVPSPDDFVAVRATGASASAAVLEEWAMVAGAGLLRQTATLAGCVLSNAAYQSYGSMAADNMAAYWTCGATGSLNRVVSRLSTSGAVQYLAYTTTDTTYLPRGAAAAAQAAYYAGDARSLR